MFSFHHSTLKRWAESISAEYDDGAICFWNKFGFAKYMR